MPASKLQAKLTHTETEPEKTCMYFSACIACTCAYAQQSNRGKRGGSQLKATDSIRKQQVLVALATGVANSKANDVDTELNSVDHALVRDTATITTE
jgi:hypothetical protein